MSKQLSCVHFLGEIRMEQGGVVNAVVDLCQAIAEGGHQVTLVTFDATDVPEVWKSGDRQSPRVVEIQPSLFTRRMASRSGLRAFEDLLTGIDVAHLHTPWELVNYQLLPKLRKRKLPYVLTAHGMLTDWSLSQKATKKKLFLSLGGRRLLDDASKIHFTAEGEMEQACRLFPIGDRAVVQGCAIDLEAYDPLPGPEPALAAFPQISSATRKILFLSRLHPVKGVELLLEAGGILRDEGLPIQLLIAGPGEESYIRQLKSLASQLRLDEQVDFLGMVRGIEKRSLFQLADVFVLPTYHENFGLVIAEAMACGTPVVTTRNANVWREIERGGARIAEHTPQSLADQIRGFVADKQESDRVGQQGLQFVRQWLDRNRIVDGYEAIYRSAISDGSQP